MTKITPTPRDRFRSMPDEARDIVTEEAAKSGLAVEDLFPDYVRIQTANVARKAAILRMQDAGHKDTVISEWFGVSRVAVAQARKGWPSRTVRAAAVRKGA